MIQRIKPGEGAPDGHAAAGLQALEVEAAQLEGAAAVASGQAEPERAPPDAAAELLQALQLARSIAAPSMSWWREFDRAWSDAALQRIADAGAAVMERHGWTLGELMGAWGPYIALVAATAPPALATYAAIRTRDVQADVQSKQPDQDPGPA